ncbi:ATP-binding cassette domain-containing protein [Aliiruegeria lutimaris]|uniref:Phosphate ABC transporter ATP-binding protein, PhoT family n=1 Tax=Aliiruegeria lutimaris TaxID=571298 RepID=A0A1G9CYF3_9RHOB|nr:ATP-binding cassette domain-containing protein [Aliiruegeria lutimaris]SDK56662.1 phosphate ABC transporter ATP-binding protein, PhoT family [Aliiruegeria lutimaris]
MVTQTILPLRLRDARVRKNGRVIVGPVDYELPADGFTIVIGPNGAGKTTLLRMMHGMERLASGAVEWQVAEKRARERQAFVFQIPVMMRRNVLENVAYPMQLHGSSRKQARAEAARWLELIGLAEAAERPAPVLSGGERQKLALARALIRKPEILFLDEPCASLDGRAMREIEAVLQSAHSEGTRIVMSTHDMGQARRLASDVLFVHRGRIHEDGPAARFFEHPQTPEARAFLQGDIVE